MRHLLAGGSKKLMLSGAGMGVLIEAAYSTGWTWYFALGVAIIGGCYCIGQGMADAASLLGFQRARAESLAALAADKITPPK